MQFPEKQPAGDVADSPFRRLRLKRGISQSELARRTGISRRAIGKADRGEVQPSPAARVLLAAALGCRPSDLIGNSGA